MEGIKTSYYQENKDNWDYYLLKQDICPISRTVKNSGKETLHFFRKCPFRRVCLRKEKERYGQMCR